MEWVKSIQLFLWDHIMAATKKQPFSLVLTREWSHSPLAKLKICFHYYKTQDPGQWQPFKSGNLHRVSSIPPCTFLKLIASHAICSLHSNTLDPSFQEYYNVHSNVDCTSGLTWQEAPNCKQLYIYLTAIITNEAFLKINANIDLFLLLPV